jgi:hypothetical protein
MSSTPIFKSRGRDTKVMFMVRYEDGRSAYIRVKPASADHGSSIVAGLAREAQDRGDIPGGTIVGVRRVR